MTRLEQRLIHLWRQQASAPGASHPWPGRFDHKIVVTLGEPVQLSGMVLNPGSYAFRMLDPRAEQGPVQIFNEDQTRLVATLTKLWEN